MEPNIPGAMAGVEATAARELTAVVSREKAAARAPH